jgi:hypothetical protein
VDKLFCRSPRRPLAALRGAAVPLIRHLPAVVEVSSVAGTLLAADAALKAAQVRLLKLHLARGIGGKGYFSMTGSWTRGGGVAAPRRSSPELLVNNRVIRPPRPTS